MSKTWKKYSSQIIYQDPWVKLRLDQVVKPNGKIGPYAFIQPHGPGVMVVPITENNEVYLIRQFRYPTQLMSWEFPGGGSEGKNLLAAAKRELWEETGLKARKWKKLGALQSFTGLSDDILHIFLAKGLTQTNTNKKHEDGILEVKKFSLPKVKLMVKLGKITDSQTISALFLIQ
ncbi:MAG: NUDIX hydrolase [Candidatus Doudnabacteria bacterium]|jgi:8-oxo-dGTP pyrophosphatase MutT (NUDIX family)